VRGVLAASRSGSYWRQVAYHVAVGPVLASGALLAVGAWASGMALIASSALRKAFPPDSAFRSEVDKSLGILLFVIGVVLVALVAPRVAAAVARLDARAARALLGPSRSEQLARRVESLAESRAGVVDAADAERRRIERDLHDGAQQRLVSLAMNLGLARQNLTELPAGARQVIIDAHEEAKEALTELRHLVRGLHPAILEDRGLDAALSGIAARTPIPVRLRVDVTERASPTVEAVAYFIVSEALANIARHARASSADVNIERTGDVLRLAVRDDGVGGADPSGAPG
jgi:signal transduction histidine kinase